VCVIVKHPNLSLSLYYILCICVYVLEHRVRFHAIHILYIYVHILYYIHHRMEKRKSDARAVRIEHLRKSGKKKDSRYVCTLRLLENDRSAEQRTFERFESSVSGGAVKKRIIDMFALFDYSKAAEALSVHAHAACTCNGRSRVRWGGGLTSNDLAALFVVPLEKDQIGQGVKRIRLESWYRESFGDPVGQSRTSIEHI